MARILIIDDEPDLREAIKVALERMGHQIDAAENGDQGLAAVRSRAFDLVVTDVLMPEVDGLVVIQTINRERPDLRILAMSGGGSRVPATYNLTVADKFGADAVLPKPFGVEELENVVTRLLSSPKARTAARVAN